jgi:hypothetical protein
MRNPKLVKISLDSVRKSFSLRRNLTIQIYEPSWQQKQQQREMENDFIYLPNMLLFH